MGNSFGMGGCIRGILICKVMKSKAPEKLYITNDEKRFNDKCHSASTEKYVNDDIEYVRTDSVIEKMQLFLIDKLKEIPMGSGKMKIKAECSLEEFIEDFQKYMEG